MDRGINRLMKRSMAVGCLVSMLGAMAITGCEKPAEPAKTPAPAAGTGGEKTPAPKKEDVKPGGDVPPPPPSDK
ncbi:MAG TPA: hypothetical protein VK176_02045 [Phycisphaerales bacterium]|nr:hypothetical protein [Phycisphaerales bacterium]